MTQQKDLVLRCMDVEKGKRKLRKNFDHPIVQNAARECCAHICDVMQFLELEYSPQMAMNIARVLTGSLAKQPGDWEDYMENGAPYNNQEFMEKLENGVV
jgi:hypothetical protein